MSEQSVSIVNSSVSTHESITFGGLYDRLKNKTLRLDAAYQRDAVPAWSKPEFIESVHDSVLRGVSLGQMCINVDSAGVWWAIDGGHRSRYISSVLAGVIDWVGGGKIADSPDDMALFLSRVIPLEVYQNLDDESAAVIFERRNGAVAMSGIAQQRGKVVKIVGDSAFRAAVDAIHAVMPTTIKRAPTRSASEETLLIALSGSLGNRDYSSKAVIKFLVENLPLALSVIPDFSARVIEFASWAAVDEEKEIKPALKRSFLSIMFALPKLPKFSDVAKFFASGKPPKDYEGESDQQKLTRAGGAGSASPAAVKTRFEVVGKIGDGSYTYFERAAKSPKKDKAESGKVESAPAPTEDSTHTAFYNVVGKGVYEPSEVDKICAWADAQMRLGIASEFRFTSDKETVKGESKIVNRVVWLPSAGGAAQKTKFATILTMD